MDGQRPKAKGQGPKAKGHDGFCLGLGLGLFALAIAKASNPSFRCNQPKASEQGPRARPQSKAPGQTVSPHLAPLGPAGWRIFAGKPENQLGARVLVGVHNGRFGIKRVIHARKGRTSARPSGKTFCRHHRIDPRSHRLRLRLRLDLPAGSGWCVFFCFDMIFSHPPTSTT